MEATVQSTHVQNYTYAPTQQAPAAVKTEKIITNKENYFGLMAMTMTIGSIFGGFVAMFVLRTDAHPVIFFFNVVAAMANNVAAIAQVEFKLMMRIFYVSTLVNALILAYLLLA